MTVSGPPPHRGNDYRPDVDGLRAVAVLMVVAFHAYPDLVPGGFAGVDVFFVISGFLITRLMLNAQDEGSFRLAAFYGNRVRRLFPALLVTLAATLVLGWQLLLPEEFRSLGRHTLASAGFVANLQLMQETGYFDTAAELKPLQHLWSLGIEEQFYLAWPLLLLLARRRLPAVAAGLMLASFAAAVVEVRLHPGAAYFSPLTRAFALLAGTLLAMAHARTAVAPAGRRRFNVAAPSPLAAAGMSAAGIALVLLSAFMVKPYYPYPGAWTLAPVLGAVLAIAAGKEALPNRLLLSWRGIVFIGLISYPLYLWHWPLLSYLQIVELRNPAPAMKNVVLVIALVLAALTHVLVERPLRHRRALTPVLALAMVVTGCAALAIAGGRLPPRLTASADIAPRAEWDFPGDLRSVTLGEQTLYRAGVNPRQALFIGDSNAQQYAPRLSDRIGRNPAASLSALFATNSGCPPIPGMQEKEGRCVGLVDFAMAQARRDANIVTVAFIANWAGVFVDRKDNYTMADAAGTYPLARPEGQARALAALEAALLQMRRAGKRTVLVLSIPTGREVDPLAYVARTGAAPAAGDRGVALATLRQRYGALNMQLRAVAARAGAEVIDPLDQLCRDGFCPATAADGSPAYKDSTHLRADFVRQQVSYLDALVAADGTPGT